MLQIIEEVDQKYQVDAHKLCQPVKPARRIGRSRKACNCDQGKSSQDNANLRQTKVQWLFRKSQVEQGHGCEMHHLGGKERLNQSC